MTFSRFRLMNKKRLGNEEVCLTCVFCNTVLAYKFIMKNGCSFSSSLLFPFALSNQTTSWCTQQLKTMKRKRNQQHTITNTRNYTTSSFEKCIFFTFSKRIFYVYDEVKKKGTTRKGFFFVIRQTNKHEPNIYAFVLLLCKFCTIK